MTDPYRPGAPEVPAGGGAGPGRAGAAACPPPRGELTAVLTEALAREPGRRRLPGRVLAERADAYGDDLQLALHLCYELHYRGWEGVDDGWEWDPGLLGLRQVLERRFLDALRADAQGTGDAVQALEGLVRNRTDGPDVPRFLQHQGEWWHMREYAVHRSLYQLKEADPHAWMIPRLTGRAKAAFVTVEYEEFGAGRAERVHAELFAGLMRDLDLEDAYGHYAHAVPAVTLATVNLMSLLGLHRARRGALAGHFAVLECTSPPGSRRLAETLRRLGAGAAAIGFYTEHVEADAVHEQLVRHEFIGDLLAGEPALAQDVAFGIAATLWLEGRLTDHLLGAWKTGRSSLRAPLG
ncbi:iron-containing redox enzyme family protein [Streptomyces sp. VNUA116]|uniref:iron-containing redox enzyme family protein n=1 Tax=Streptomyces sp. VNUA116 TaxID=3062449 RepID=UPI002675C193|nr:iron-containing redox enzyme family protein [Streptomyces sp. VNUA116]WKU48487.1 iron-containing redox enzyme family protein [Streptomyces sp. VNUA116]